jgi:hypothetical protein
MSGMIFAGVEISPFSTLQFSLILYGHVWLPLFSHHRLYFNMGLLLYRAQNLLGCGVAKVKCGVAKVRCGVTKVRCGVAKVRSGVAR